jgi:3-mercaptopyruvate sulfurtransferase SseA
LVSSTPRADETLVLYSEGGAHAAQGWVLLRAQGHEHVYFLRGGLLDWLDDVMNPVLPATGAADTTAANVAALSRYFGGVPRTGDAGSAPSVDLRATATSSVARVKRRGC